MGSLRTTKSVGVLSRARRAVPGADGRFRDPADAPADGGSRARRELKTEAVSLRREGRVDDALARMRKAKTVEHALASRPWQDGRAPRMPLRTRRVLGTTPIARATPRGATPIAPRLAPGAAAAAAAAGRRVPAVVARPPAVRLNRPRWRRERARDAAADAGPARRDAPDGALLRLTRRGARRARARPARRLSVPK
ncbi:hypothetical protein SO694_00029043 [Aureococcus anophagefferens]|uniref:Uncharacterized protein n=1 Tax=Aureococcus anophagefferens TaxID=44056 RepID=A0ABR1FVX0_AURAN